MVLFIKIWTAAIVAAFSATWGAVLVAQSAVPSVPNTVIGVGGFGVALAVIAWIIKASTRVEKVFLSGLEAAITRAEAAEKRVIDLVAENDRLRDENFRLRIEALD